MRLPGNGGARRRDRLGSARIVPTWQLILNAPLSVTGVTAQSSEAEKKALDLGAQYEGTTSVQTRSLLARVLVVRRRVRS